MVESAMCRAVALDHRLEEDPDEAGGPLAHHGRHALFVRMTEPSEKIAEWQTLRANAAIAGPGQIGRQPHGAYRVGHLVQNLAAILRQDDHVTVGGALRKIITKEPGKRLNGKRGAWIRARRWLVPIQALVSP